MPHPEIIKLYKDLGGEIITIGSDSHKAESVAYKNKASIDPVSYTHLDVYKRQ